MGNDPTVGWDLTGYSVELMVNDAVLPRSAITVPSSSPLGASCDESIAASNNRNFLPDILAMSGSTGLVADWKARLQGRLTLHGGSLSVNKLAPGCFTFYDKNTAKDTRRLADGQKGLLYTRDIAANELTLRVADGAGRVVGHIVMRPDAGAIRLTLNTHDTMNPAANSLIEHFKYFYELVASGQAGSAQAARSASSRQIPKWLGVKSGGVTPGEACPPGFFDVP